MSVKPETKYLNAIRVLLDARGAKQIKLHGSSFMKLGNPDIIGSLYGITFVVETKFHNGILSDKQVYELGQWEATGAVVETPREGSNPPEEVVAAIALKVWLARRKIMREEIAINLNAVVASNSRP